jgi:OmpA-OmpF porin, OOP family
MNQIASISRALPAAALVLALAACSSAPRVGFPDPALATVRGGTYIDAEQLNQYQSGMNKDQLYALLGVPHFNEGLFGVRRWNYLLNVRTEADATPQRCQLRIDFDPHGVAQGEQWSPASCSALVARRTPAPSAPVAALPAPAIAPATTRISVEADALFAFGSAALTAQGQQRLQQVVRELRNAHAVDGLAVVGHADRIGSAGSNLALSQRRAAAVRDYLVALGLPRAAIRAEGRGSAEPKVACAGDGGDALVACLAPNRRVDITALASVSQVARGGR